MAKYEEALEDANKKLEKSVQFLNDSAIKLQAETDALKKALLTCSVKRQELQTENKALRETILGEVTTADSFNSEFRHNPDDDAPDAPSAVTWNARALNTEVNDVDTVTIVSAKQFTPVSGTYRMTAYDPDDDTTAYDTTKCDSCQKEIPFDDTNFVQNSDGTVRYECNVCYNLDS